MPTRQTLAAAALCLFFISFPVAATLYAVGNVFWITFAALGGVSIVSALLLGAS